MTDRRWGDRQACKRTDRWSTVRRVLGERSSTFEKLHRYIGGLSLAHLVESRPRNFYDGRYGTLYSPETIRGPQHLYGREISKFMSIRLEMPSKNIIVVYILHICMYFLHVATYLNWLDPLSRRSCLLFCSRSWKTSREFFSRREHHGRVPVQWKSFRIDAVSRTKKKMQTFGSGSNRFMIGKKVSCQMALV